MKIYTIYGKLNYQQKFDFQWDKMNHFSTINVLLFSFIKSSHNSIKQFEVFILKLKSSLAL